MILSESASKEAIAHSFILNPTSAAVAGPAQCRLHLLLAHSQYIYKVAPKNM
jgi:hypothetical protein